MCSYVLSGALKELSVVNVKNRALFGKELCSLNFKQSHYEIDFLWTKDVSDSV